MYCLWSLSKGIDISVTNVLGLIALWCIDLPCCVLAGVRQWCFTDLCILKVGFAPVKALQPLLYFALSGKQADCNEADGCLPGVSRSLSVIYPSSSFFFLKKKKKKRFGFVGFLIRASLSPIACSLACACVCACAGEREAEREAVPGLC